MAAELAATRLLRDDPPAALPAVLQRVAGCFSARASLALQCTAAGQLGVLAAYPRQAGTDPALLAGIGALVRKHPELAASGGSLQARLAAKPGGGRHPVTVLLAWPEPAPGQPPCVLALTGDAPGDAPSWSRPAESAARAVASIVAAHLQHARQEQERTSLLAAEQRARHGLADQTQRLQSLIAAAIPGVLFTDEHGMITQLNQSFCDLFGIAEEPGQLAGTPVTGLVREIKKVFSDPAEFVRRTGEAAARRQPASGEQMACSDGRTLECDYWPVLADGHYRGDLWLAWDMSDRTALAQQRERAIEAELAARELAELAQQQLEEQNRRLQQAASAKTQYLAAASHELGTPLTSIVAFTDLIRHDPGGISADVGQALDVIERNAEQLRHMVGELSLLSRIEAGILPLNLAPVSVPALIDQAARSASAGAARRGSTIEVSAPDGPPVQGDRHRLRQVLDNLIANAVKFSDPGGRVRVSASRDGPWWRIEVEDSGIGIPAAELGTIFGRFSRASNARIAGLPGTGLGLSIVKAITEMHGGRVEARSTPGKQTVFRVCLPVRPPPGAAG
ncbi:MAG: ATP-binding protein [Streptosporangiaceae bacterium]